MAAADELRADRQALPIEADRNDGGRMSGQVEATGMAQRAPVGRLDAVDRDRRPHLAVAEGGAHHGRTDEHVPLVEEALPGEDEFVEWDVLVCPAMMCTAF